MAKQLRLETAFATYTTGGVLGEGGSGRVYEAVDDTGQDWAVKLLDAKKATSDRRKRFKNEVIFCERPPHPGILRVVDSGIAETREGKTPFYVMPRYAGSLRNLLKKGIAPQQTLEYYSQVLDAVEAAHLKKVVHRDLKPENILVSKDEKQLIVADFGIAHFEEDDLITAVETKVQERLANFVYAAPEQAVRNGVVDQRADIYALGLILNEMFTAEVPRGTGYKKIGDVSGEHAYLDSLVESMLQQNIAARPATIEAVKTTLIARKNEFINLQRLDHLRETVVDASSIDDDPLIADPLRIVDFDWQNGTLTLIFSQTVDGRWIWALQNMGNYNSLAGKGPNHWRVSGNRASIGADERQVQMLIDHFKQWLPTIHSVYVERLRQEKAKAEREKIAEIQAEAEELERRNRLRQSVKL